MKNLWAELKRRKVVRVAIFYLVGAWVLLQMGETILGLGDFPGWIGQILLAVVVVGLPVALVLSWLFDITPEGVIADDAEDVPLEKHHCILCLCPLRPDNLI